MKCRIGDLLHLDVGRRERIDQLLAPASRREVARLQERAQRSQMRGNDRLAAAPADINVEKIAYSAFHASRLEWVLRKCGIEQLYFTGIVTNGGVASTVRDAHVREFHCTVIADGCAAFSREVHDAAIEGLRPVAKVIAVADAMRHFAAL